MIRLDAVTRRFGALTAVDNVSLAIERGASFALLGPNGAGKTTIVRMLLDFIKPTAGRITLGGRAASDPKARRAIGYLAESHAIPPYLCGLVYLKRHAALMGLTGKEAFREVDRVLEITSMAADRNLPSAACSKGMRQRLGLGAALLGRPECLILDEPTSGLDPIGMRDVRKILEILHDRKVTLLVNSHLLSEVEKTCKTVGIMHNGKVLIKGAVASIVKDRETLEDVFIRYIETENE